MKVAAYQAPLLPAGSMEALGLIRDRVKWCETEGVDILCCPEAVLGGLADDAQCPVDIAIDVESGQLETLLAPLASKSVTAIVGFTETAGTGKLYNAAAVFHDGESCRHLPQAPSCDPEVRVQRRGPKPGLHHRPSFVRDHDLQLSSNFPELATDMVARGARTIFLPSNNSLPPERANMVAFSRAIDIARARDNEVMIVRADVAGRTTTQFSFGLSAIVDACGTVLRVGEGLSEDILFAELHTRGQHIRSCQPCRVQ